MCQAAGPRKGTRSLGRVVDISAGGIGLIVYERFEVGAHLAVTLLHKALSRSLQVQAVHVSEVAPGYYLLGGVLNSQLEAEELQALLK